MVEHGAHNPRVAGSIPAGPTADGPGSTPEPAGCTRAPRFLYSVGYRTFRTRKEPPIEPSDELDSPDDDAAPVVRLADESRALALSIAEVISDTPAANTLVLDIHAISPVADCFVICSGENERQLRAIAREILEKLGEAGVRPERSEGTAAAGWILLDFGEVIVHVMDVDQRVFYRLEELWSEAQTLLAIQ